MALRNNLVHLFVLLFPFNLIEAKIILPELMTKQAINNIRFLTQDGKYTYYQKRSGSLLFSTNYKVQEMLKGELGTQYTLYASAARKKIVILQNLNYHNFYSLRGNEKIFITNFGESTATEIGLGTNPTLLLNDSWISYYDFYEKILKFENTTNSALKFSIRLNNRINPYFAPQVVMSDDNTIYYTDLSETGVIGVLEFKRNTGKSQIIYKGNGPMEKAEICLHQDHLILGIFGINFSNTGSIISSASLPLTDFSKRDFIYKSNANDLGHMICDFDKENIVFIKNYGNSFNPNYDIVNFNLKNKSLSLLSELKTVGNVLNMDGILLTEEKGKYYIVKGYADYKNVDTLKAKPETTNKSPNKQKEEDAEKQFEND